MTDRMNDDRQVTERNLDTIAAQQDPVFDRLEKRSGREWPEDMTVPQQIEWAAARYGWDDSDVIELADLEAEYDAIRDMLAEEEESGDGMSIVPGSDEWSIEGF